MKIILMSMPDVAPVIIHEMAIHIANLGLASIGGNIDDVHDVYIIDLVRKRSNVKKYIVSMLNKLKPDIVGLSAMSWQYDTCIKIMALVKKIMPDVKIMLGGYHATLMYKEIGKSKESRFIDFIIRGEGEEACRRLVNALSGKDNLEDIPSLSFKSNGKFIHNPKGGLLDLSKLKLPIRDKRRLTRGYHIMNMKIEAMETSRGCTRSCNFCSIRHMYGKSFRTFPISRVLADIDYIYYKLKTKWIFITDDNLVLDTDRVMELCDAIIAKKYENLILVVQADCISMSKNEQMVKKMAQAGFKSVFLGIENVSAKNLKVAKKGNIVEASKRAVYLCHKYDIMIIGGLVLGFPDDDENSLIENFEFFNSLNIDAAYCQLLTPYPKTGIRESLMEQGLVTNPFDYKKYNGMWANVKTRHLEANELQYLFWYHKQNVLGWWKPSPLVSRDGKLWTSIWKCSFKPVAKYFLDRKIRKLGWERLYKEDVKHLEKMNLFEDLEEMGI